MARIRTIKPEFWSDDTITECSLSARLLFIGIWNFADDAGNLDRSSKQIKARVFPNDNVDCEPLLQELLQHGLLTEYSVNDRKYLHIPGFSEHQVINRPSKPVVPQPPQKSDPHVTLSESSVSTPSGREGKGRDIPSSEPTTPTSKRAKPRTTISPDNPLDDGMREAALKRYPDCDPEEMHRQFVAHHVSKGSLMASWRAAWTTWLGNAEKFGYPKRRIADRGIHAGVVMR